MTKEEMRTERNRLKQLTDRQLADEVMDHADILATVKQPSDDQIALVGLCYFEAAYRFARQVCREEA